MKLKLSGFKFARVLRVTRAALKEIIEVTEGDSDNGVKITPDEWKQIGAAIAVALAQESAK